MKFKVGDKVRILDGANIEDYAGGWSEHGMRKYVGEVATVQGIDGRGYNLSCDEREFCQYRWDERGLELVEEAEQPKVDEQKADEPKVEVNGKANKAHFMGVAAKVTHDKFNDLIKKCPELVLLFAMYSSALADALFED